MQTVLSKLELETSGPRCFKNDNKSAINLTESCSPDGILASMGKLATSRSAEAKDTGNRTSEGRKRRRKRKGAKFSCDQPEINKTKVGDEDSKTQPLEEPGLVNLSDMDEKQLMSEAQDVLTNTDDCVLFDEVPPSERTLFPLSEYPNPTTAVMPTSLSAGDVLCVQHPPHSQDNGDTMIMRDDYSLKHLILPAGGFSKFPTKALKDLRITWISNDCTLSGNYRKELMSFTMQEETISVLTGLNFVMTSCRVKCNNVWLSDWNRHLSDISYVLTMEQVLIEFEEAFGRNFTISDHCQQKRLAVKDVEETILLEENEVDEALNQCSPTLHEVYGEYELDSSRGGVANYHEQRQLTVKDIQKTEETLLFEDGEVDEFHRCSPTLGVVYSEAEQVPSVASDYQQKELVVKDLKETKEALLFEENELDEELNQCSTTLRVVYSETEQDLSSMAGDFVKDATELVHLDQAMDSFPSVLTYEDIAIGYSGNLCYSDQFIGQYEMSESVICELNSALFHLSPLNGEVLSMFSLPKCDCVTDNDNMYPEDQFGNSCNSYSEMSFNCSPTAELQQLPTDNGDEEQGDDMGCSIFRMVDDVILDSPDECYACECIVTEVVSAEGDCPLEEEMFLPSDDTGEMSLAFEVQMPSAIIEVDSVQKEVSDVTISNEPSNQSLSVARDMIGAPLALACIPSGNEVEIEVSQLEGAFMPLNVEEFAQDFQIWTTGALKSTEGQTPDVKFTEPMCCERLEELIQISSEDEYTKEYAKDPPASNLNENYSSCEEEVDGTLFADFSEADINIDHAVQPQMSSCGLIKEESNENLVVAVTCNVDHTDMLSSTPISAAADAAAATEIPSDNGKSSPRSCCTAVDAVEGDSAMFLDYPTKSAESLNFLVQGSASYESGFWDFGDEEVELVTEPWSNGRTLNCSSDEVFELDNADCAVQKYNEVDNSEIEASCADSAVQFANEITDVPPPDFGSLDQTYESCLESADNQADDRTDYMNPNVQPLFIEYTHMSLECFGDVVANFGAVAEMSMPSTEVNGTFGIDEAYPGTESECSSARVEPDNTDIAIHVEVEPGESDKQDLLNFDQIVVSKNSKCSLAVDPSLSIEECSENIEYFVLDESSSRVITEIESELCNGRIVPKLSMERLDSCDSSETSILLEDTKMDGLVSNATSIESINLDCVLIETSSVNITIVENDEDNEEDSEAEETCSTKTDYEGSTEAESITDEVVWKASETYLMVEVEAETAHSNEVTVEVPETVCTKPVLNTEVAPISNTMTYSNTSETFSIVESETSAQIMTKSSGEDFYFVVETNSSPGDTSSESIACEVISLIEPESSIEPSDAGSTVCLTAPKTNKIIFSDSESHSALDMSRGTSTESIDAEVWAINWLSKQSNDGDSYYMVPSDKTRSNTPANVTDTSTVDTIIETANDDSEVGCTEATTTETSMTHTEANMTCVPPTTEKPKVELPTIAPSGLFSSIEPYGMRSISPELQSYVLSSKEVCAETAISSYRYDPMLLLSFDYSASMARSLTGLGGDCSLDDNLPYSRNSHSGVDTERCRAGASQPQLSSASSATGRSSLMECIYKLNTTSGHEAVNALHAVQDLRHRAVSPSVVGGLVACRGAGEPASVNAEKPQEQTAAMNENGGSSLFSGFVALKRFLPFSGFFAKKPTASSSVTKAESSSAVECARDESLDKELDYGEKEGNIPIILDPSRMKFMDKKTRHVQHLVKRALATQSSSLGRGQMLQY